MTPKPNPAPLAQPGLAANLLPCPMDRWVAYAKRGGLLDENGVATDRTKAQTAFYAFSEAWNESHRAVLAALAQQAVREPEPAFERCPCGTLGRWVSVDLAPNAAVDAINAQKAEIDQLKRAVHEDTVLLDWVRDTFFLHKWNAVIGPGYRTDWSIIPHYRHIRLQDASGNAAGDFREAIRAARAPAEKENDS